MKKGYRFAAFSLLGGPVQVFTAEDFLYPQYDEKFRKFKVASKDWLTDTAKNLLEEGWGTPEVRARWQTIVDGSFFKKG